MIKHLLIAGLTAATFNASANDYVHLTPNDVVGTRHIQCPINKRKNIDPQLLECLKYMGIYNHTYFVFNVENITYKGEFQGDKVKGRIVPMYVEWAAL